VETERTRERERERERKSERGGGGGWEGELREGGRGKREEEKTWFERCLRLLRSFLGLFPGQTGIETGIGIPDSPARGTLPPPPAHF